ncbi:hypothetical protein [Pleionea sediminis]|uniref:hypothetical protein n=1 Tax=Pleionea sediminis TaxID=2569479 RepID=UPI001185FB8C|nr:hypothetical protein [Pleionea sediminis]
MIQFTFKKPPFPALICYLIGFIIISVTMAHQFLNWNWLSVKTNQQIFIVGALTVAVGSLLNWILPLLKKPNKTEDDPS